MILKEQLTETKIEALEKLRRRTIHHLSPKLLEDQSLFYRFLKARNFNVDKAEALLMKHIAWRKEFKVDTIITDFVEPPLVNYVPTNIFGFDKEGYPVRYIDFGAADHKGILNSAKRIDCIKYLIKLWEMNFEIFKDQSTKLGRIVHYSSYIVNCGDLTFAKVTNKQSIELLLYVAAMQQDNYPEIVKNIYVINASVYYSILWSMVKLVVAPGIQAKIKVFGTDGWKESLLESIDGDQLPAFLGGSRTDPDGNPLCNTFIVHGKPVPKSFYLKKSTKNLVAMPGVKRLRMYPRSKSSIEFDVIEENSFLQWEFETKSNDIGFGVYFQEGLSEESDEIELVPKQRFDTYFGSETGMYKCAKTGKYIILFDNSYSWLRPKEIYYRVKIISSKKTEWTEGDGCNY